MAPLLIGRRRIKFRFFIIIFLLISGIAYLYSTLKPPPVYATLSYGKVLVKDNAHALIIREEELFTAPAYGKVVYNATDGEMIAKDQPIALLYKENFQEDTVYKLYSIQEKISEYQNDRLLDQILDIDIIRLNDDIIKTVEQIQLSVLEGKIQEIPSTENQLRRLLGQKQRLIDKKTEPDAYLTQLYASEADALKQLKDWTVEMIAPKSGLISFRLDGLENVLDRNSIDKLTADDFKQLMNYKVNSDKSGEAKTEQPFFRIINPQVHWYAVFETNTEDVYYNKGEMVQVSVFSDIDITLTAKVYKLLKEKNNTIVFLELSGHTEYIVNHRTIPLQISKAIEGFMIPETALKEKKGNIGIYINKREGDIFTEISIKGIAEGFAIIEALSDNQIIELHNQVRIR